MTSRDNGATSMDLIASDLSLRAFIREIQPNYFQVEYVLTNSTRSSVLVLNKLYQTAPSGRRTIDDNAVYIVFDADTIHFTRAALRIPAGLKVEYPEVPYGTILAAGHSLNERFIVVSPVREAQPYARAGGGESRAVGEYPLKLAIGVVPLSDELTLKRPAGASGDIWLISYGDAIRRQIVVSSSLHV